MEVQKEACERTDAKNTTFLSKEAEQGTKKIPDTIICTLTGANQYQCVTFPMHLHFQGFYL